MARGQGAAGHRGPPPPLSSVGGAPPVGPGGASAAHEPAPSLTVAVHDLHQAGAALEAAAELGLSIELATAPGLTAFAGVGFCVALERAVGRPVLIDCGQEPGTALAALRAGARRVLVRSSAAVRGKLLDIARQVGAELSGAPVEPSLVLAPGEDPRGALRAALAAASARDPSLAAPERL